MRIEEATEKDREIWNSFIYNNKNASLYHLFEWKEIIEKSFGHRAFYLMAADGEEIKGGLPLVVMKGLFGSIAVSMPFLNYGGICTSDPQAEALLIEEATKVAKGRKAKYLELRSNREYNLNWPLKTHKVSMTLELDPDPEVLWSRFTTKHRTTIRKAGKNDLELRSGKKELLRDFYSVICQGWRSLGTPLYGYPFFENVVDELGEHIEIHLVLHKGQPVATAMNGLFKDTVEGMWLASLDEFYRLQGGYFLYWGMIKRACEKGYRRFHLGRSTADSGGEFFKKKWNAFPQQLFWYYYLNRVKELPDLDPRTPRFAAASKVWRRLPLWITNLVGPRIARGIP